MVDRNLPPIRSVVPGPGLTRNRLSAKNPFSASSACSSGVICTLYHVAACRLVMGGCLKSPQDDRCLPCTVPSSPHHRPYHPVCHLPRDFSEGRCFLIQLCKSTAGPIRLSFDLCSPPGPAEN